VITLALPATMALQRVLVVAGGGARVAFPLASVDEVIDLLATPPIDDEGGAVIDTRDGTLPLVSLARALGAASDGTGGITGAEHAVTLHDGAGGRVAVAVQGVVGQHEVVLKRWAAPLGRTPRRRFTGGTILGDGLPALIVDVGTLISRLS
jgi:chemotaxis protein histidine kinase CheA